MTQHAIAALRDKRQELQARANKLTAELRTIAIQIEHIEASLRVFVPGYKFERVRRENSRPAFPGLSRQMLAHIMDVLRNAKEPMTSAEIAKAIMANKGMNAGDEYIYRTVSARVQSALTHYREKGLVQSVKMDGSRQRWEVLA